MADEEMTTDDHVDAMLAEIPVAPSGDGYVGSAPDWFGPTLFGGFVVGQAVNAAMRTAPAGFELTSLHGYFLSAMRAGEQNDYEVSTLRDGRSFAQRSLVGSQNGKPFFSMQAAFAAPGQPSHYEYGRSLDPAVPRPADLELDAEADPFDGAWLGPTDPEPDGFLASSMRRWFRFARPLGDDATLHATMLAYATDMTGLGARPLQLDESHGIEGIVSLDHAVHFHRPTRADQWLLYDVTSTINTGGRGLLRGHVYTEDGTHVASVTQETLLWDPAVGR